MSPSEPPSNKGVQLTAHSLSLPVLVVSWRQPSVYQRSGQCGARQLMPQSVCSSFGKFRLSSLAISNVKGVEGRSNPYGAFVSGMRARDPSPACPRRGVCPTVILPKQTFDLNVRFSADYVCFSPRVKT